MFFKYIQNVFVFSGFNNYKTVFFVFAPLNAETVSKLASLITVLIAIIYFHGDAARNTEKSCRKFGKALHWG